MPTGASVGPAMPVADPDSRAADVPGRPILFRRDGWQIAPFPGRAQPIGATFDVRGHLVADLLDTQLAICSECGSNSMVRVEAPSTPASVTTRWTECEYVSAARSVYRSC